MGDSIKDLPVDQMSKEDPAELQLAANLFGTVGDVVNNPNVVSHFRPTMLAALIFLILSLPQLDTFIASFSRRPMSPYVMVLVKAVIFFVVLYVASNFSLAKK